MAVNIDTVYQSVLALANKEQRGYITPLEFNLMASKAQREIFEQYFYDINKFSRMPGNSTEFSDMLYILEEKIAHFRVSEASLTAVASYADYFEVDITGWSTVNPDNGTVTHVAPASTNNYNGGIKILQNAGSGVIGASASFGTLTAGKKYKASWTITDMEEPSFYVIKINDGATVVYHQELDPSIGSFNFTFAADNTVAHTIIVENSDTADAGKYITVGEVTVEEIDNATLANNVYRLGDVYVDNKVIPEVTAKQARSYGASPLAKPTQSNPTYVRKSASSVEIHPSGITGTIAYDYVKTPSDPYWGYVVTPSSSGGSEYPLYDASSTTHFELHESEEPTLVNRILEMSGVTMKQPDVVQYGSTKNNEEFQKENS